LSASALLPIRALMAPRVLIVDDHPLTREALASLLEQHGFEVAGQAGDGAEAIVLAAELTPDLVLLDLTMPGMDGLTAISRIRDAAPACELPAEERAARTDRVVPARRGRGRGRSLGGRRTKPARARP
jgi:DNA-binding NarL/FixJ family response regulator